MGEYAETKEVEIGGHKFKIREITIEDLINLRKIVKELPEETMALEHMAYTISAAVIEPKMTHDEALKLPIRIATELQNKILEMSGFPVEGLKAFGRMTTSTKTSLTYSSPIEVISQEQRQKQEG